ncbi:MAG: hypothetical protein AAFY17_07530 [Cyanobacteria bacterium J06642_11]
MKLPRYLINEIFIGALMGGTILFLWTGTYVVLSDCSPDGIRASKWIDDPLSGQCLHLGVRSVLLWLVPSLWLGSIGGSIYLRQMLLRSRRP